MKLSKRSTKILQLGDSIICNKACEVINYTHSAIAVMILETGDGVRLVIRGAGTYDKKNDKKVK